MTCACKYDYYDVSRGGAQHETPDLVAGRWQVSSSVAQLESSDIVQVDDKTVGDAVRPSMCLHSHMLFGNSANRSRRSRDVVVTYNNAR